MPLDDDNHVHYVDNVEPLTLSRMRESTMRSDQLRTHVRTAPCHRSRDLLVVLHRHLGLIFIDTYRSLVFASTETWKI